MTGKELQTLLKKKKLSVSEFSKMINISESSLKEYLRSDEYLRNDIVISACRRLDLDIDTYGINYQVISRRGADDDSLDLDDVSKLLDK